jgi:GT2 family glycosyltransferase
MSGLVSAPRVSIIIPNWNGARWLERCLRSLRAQHFSDFELLVVDNGSTDDSLALVQQCFPEARCLAMGRNVGFAAAVNAGIRATCGEFVVLLNNDTEADPGWLAGLVEALDRRPEFTFAASRMRQDERRDLIDGAGDALNWYGIPSKIGHGETDGAAFDEEREVFGACAGAALYRRSLFAEIGLFEETFFAYIEDVDVSFRARLAGHRCLYVPAAVVYHVGSATAGRNSDFALQLATRNQLLMVVRNFPWPIVLTRLLKVFHAHYWIVRGAWSEGRIRVVLASYGSFLRHLPGALVARRRIQATRRVGVVELESVMDRCEHLESRKLRVLRRAATLGLGLRR